jgi:hypothetical protein
MSRMALCGLVRELARERGAVSKDGGIADEKAPRFFLSSRSQVRADVPVHRQDDQGNRPICDRDL